MSTYLDSPLAIQKSAEITKYLRSRDFSLSSLLPLALEILEEGRSKEQKTYFPQKEDWLLEWLVQRLREDDSSASDSRCDHKFWDFLLYLLPLSTCGSGILRKHNLLQLVSKTFSEAALLPIEATMADHDVVDTAMGDEDDYSTPKKIPSSSSNSTEYEPPAWRALSKLRNLLESISAVLSYLQKTMGVGKRERNIVVVLRGAPDIGAQIIGSYLEACQVLLQHGIEPKEEWTSAVMGVWRGCIWGNPNSKKLSMIFSTFCLVPATRLLAEHLIPYNLKYNLEQLIVEFMFSHEILFPTISGVKSLKASSKDLKPLLEPLAARKEGLSQLLRTAMNSQTTKRRPDSDIVEAIFESITAIIPGVTIPTATVDDSDAEIVMNLLAVLVETSTTVPSNKLAILIDGASNISHSNTDLVRWNIIEAALKVDFEIFLGVGSEVRTLKLIDRLTNSCGKDIVYKVLELLIDGFVKARDLEGFVKTWTSELDKDRARGGVWESDRVARYFAEQMEKALLPIQVEKIFRVAIQEENWVIIDAVLRGVKRKETEDKIRGLLSKIFEGVVGSNAGWRGWRALVRGLQIENGLVAGKQKKLLNIMKKTTEGNIEDEARKKLFIGEALMNSADIEGQGEVLSVGIKEIRCVNRGWDGSVGDIDPENLGIALVIGFVSRWIGAIERVPADVRTGFVDEFLNMAINNFGAHETRIFTGRTVWQGMLARGISYEYPALKDAILAALIKKLEPFSDISRGISTSLTDIQKIQYDSMNETDIDRYEFLLESIAKYPLEALKRTARERILDTLILLEAVLEKGGLLGGLRGKAEELIERLWMLGNANCFLARNANEFMTWSSRKGKKEKVERRILRYVFATKEQERSHRFLNNLIALAESKFPGTGKPEIKILKACEIIVEEFWRAGDESDVKRLRKNILDQLRESIEAGEVNGDFVGAWRRMWVLDRNPNDTKEALALAHHIIENSKKMLPEVFKVTENAKYDERVEDATKTVAETTMLLCACSTTSEEAFNTTALVVGILDSSSAQQYKSDITISYGKMFSDGLDLNTYLECMAVVIKACFTPINDGTIELGYWETLKILINKAKKPEEEELSKRVANCLSTLFSRLAWNLPRAKTVTKFLAIADCMSIILGEKTWAVMQYNIDETLVSVATTTSPLGPQFTPMIISADEIFLNLCSLSRLVLSLHRRRIRGGRYHLVIATLKSLLHCIYKRKAARERKKSDRIVHPPWLLPTTQPCSKDPATITKIPTLTRKCADNFNRLLTTFCEPSASSVRNRMRSITEEDLFHSVRDREKREVASCVGSLLGEILKGSLEGGFDGDITVGVSAVFEVLGAEGVKGFAKTIDKEGRAMLRELWDEYNRVGGGAGEKL